MVFDKKAWMKEYNAQPEHKEEVREAVKRRYWANRNNPEFVAKKREADRKYRLSHLEQKRQKDREYAQRVKPWRKPSFREYQNRWRRGRPQKRKHEIHMQYKAYHSRRYYKLKEMLVHILGQYWCQRCGQHDKRCLQLDHINGGGCYEYSKGPRARFPSVRRMQIYYIKHPDEARKCLQVLCANCNWIKRFTNRENGKFLTTVPTLATTHKIKVIKLESQGVVMQD